MESISVFQIIKIGIGPSSSHTMGPWNAARRFTAYLRLKKKQEEVRELSVHLFGSLAKTGKGHGTDVAVLLGLSGEKITEINTQEIPDKIARLRASKQLQLGGTHSIFFNPESDIEYHWQKSLDFHPNGIRFSATINDGEHISREYFSIGGGFVVRERKREILNDSAHTPFPCHRAEDILQYCKLLNCSVSELVLKNEKTWRSENEIQQKVLGIWNEMKNCIFKGVKAKGSLPGGLNVKRRAGILSQSLLESEVYQNADEWIMAIKESGGDFRTINRWVSIFALAVNEENASFGRVITAPTNGASGVLPAVLMYAHCFLEDFKDEYLLDFILTAGEIGTLYKKGATLSAAMGGCQAEIGVSSSMAAAGLAEIMGGSPEQVLQAAEIAMEHHLGMTCDPIGGLVQIPCIERNAMGAIKAITAAHLALDDAPGTALVSLDNVIKSMWETAQDMNYKYKETSEGGLAKISVNVIEC